MRVFAERCVYTVTMPGVTRDCRVISEASASAKRADVTMLSSKLPHPNSQRQPSRREG